MKKNYSNLCKFFIDPFILLKSTSNDFIKYLTQISRQTIRLLVCWSVADLWERRWKESPRILGARSGTLYFSETSGNASGSIGVQYPQTSH